MRDTSSALQWWAKSVSTLEQAEAEWHRCAYCSTTAHPQWQQWCASQDVKSVSASVRPSKGWRSTLEKTSQKFPRSSLEQLVDQGNELGIWERCHSVHLKRESKLQTFNSGEFYGIASRVTGKCCWKSGWVGLQREKWLNTRTTKWTKNCQHWSLVVCYKHCVRLRLCAQWSGRRIGESIGSESSRALREESAPFLFSVMNNAQSPRLNGQ